MRRAEIGVLLHDTDYFKDVSDHGLLQTATVHDAEEDALQAVGGSWDGL